jgi:hypothetical protein
MKGFSKIIARMLASCDLDISTKEMSEMSDEDFRALLIKNLQKQFPDLTPEIYKEVLTHYGENPSSLTLKDHIGWYFESKKILNNKEELADLIERIRKFHGKNTESALSVLNRDLWPPHHFKEFPVDAGE